MNKHFMSAVAICISLLVSSCGGGDGGAVLDPEDGNPASDGPTTGPSAGNSGNSGNSGDCTNVWTTDINSPTLLVNGPAYCDYLLDSSVSVHSLLSIEPGVVVRVGADRRIVVDGGELQALGTPDQRIVFEGLTPVQGFWLGIDVNEGRSVSMDYVDIKDAGQVCTIIFCPDVAMDIDEVSFSFTNSTVSNSHVHGMSISRDVNIEAFANNRFYGNALNGLIVAIENIPSLDSGSDYAGGDSPNGQPGVRVASGSQERGETFVWKKLNAPYFITGFVHVEGGILRLDPGAELVFDEEAWMTVEGNGVFQALGTAAEPIIIRGWQDEPGYWEGITFRRTSFSTHRIQHTTLSHSGNTEGLLSSLAAVRLDESDITVASTTFSDNSRWGIFCTEPSVTNRASVIVDEDGNHTFSNNGSGNVSGNCSVQ